MVFLGKISPEKRAYIAYLSQDKDFKVKDICKKTGISRATVHRIKQDKNCLGKRKKDINKGGRPRKLSAHDERNIIRAVKKLRRTRGNYSTREIMSTSGIEPSEISERTVRRYLNKNGYFSLQSRKKGLLSEADCKRRLKFAREMKRNYSPEVWKDDIFYLDGERFPVMFPKVAKSSRIFLQDNAPNQNSACVRGALRRVKAKQLEFPPRSGDLNPIENVFKNAKALLQKQAINENIQYETYDEFKWRVINTLKAFSVTQIDKTIASMNKRIDMVIQKKGDRTKY
ncbi:Transposable element Tc1 transposase [Exaiptasia diaphana]|nr:Transposable element Tc1 transposase [Exaiptasia diaphana]